MRFNDQSRFIDEINQENIDAISHITREEKKSGGLLSQEPKLLGVFKPKQLSPKIDLNKFIPSPPEKIEEGMKVLHPKFGEGDVKSIDDRRVATIHFPFASDGKEKRIVLQFAKLQILI
jgi:DNA helicase-2/ATP-dependent DNA helicase PcrA